MWRLPDAVDGRSLAPIGRKSAFAELGVKGEGREGGKGIRGGSEVASNWSDNRGEAFRGLAARPSRLDSKKAVVKGSCDCEGKLPHQGDIKEGATRR